MIEVAFSYRELRTSSKPIATRVFPKRCLEPQNVGITSRVGRKAETVMSRPRVLVVDDSPTTCQFIAVTLEQAGYDVKVALEGHEGLAKITIFQPSCLILDVVLPDISGYAICRHVQQSMPGNTVYIILISSKNAPLDQSYGLRQGAHHY
jgi:CheY-like chemotaxis protein